MQSRNTQQGESAGIGARVWLLALMAQATIILWIVRSEITARVFVSSWTLSMPAMLLLLALLTWNALRRRPLQRSQLLTAYVAVSSTVTLVGYNFFQVLLPTLGTGLYFQSPENGWGRILPYLPAWLLPRDRAALRGLFYGESAVPWGVWIAPLVAWGALVLAVMLASLALNGLLAELWIRKERLAFPIAALPLELTQPQGGFFRNRWVWLGIALPVVLDSLLALHYYYPGIPAIEMKHTNWSSGLTNPPMSIITPVFVGFTPFILGLAYLAPLDVSFSIWFFLWLGKAERLLAFSLGQVDAGDLESLGPPYLDEQAVGGFLAMGLWIFWHAWIALRRQDARNAVPPSPLNRMLLLFLGGTLLFILAFLRLAGLSLWLAASLIALYFLTVVVISRVRSEAGFAWAYGPNRFSWSLSQIVVNVYGSAHLAPQNLAVMGFFHWLWWDLRFALMPAQMDALKIGDAAPIRRRSLLALMAAATAVAVVVGLAWVLHDSYRFGWATAKTYFGPAEGAKQNYILIHSWMQNPTFPQWNKIAWMVLGGSFTLLLGLLRQRFVWWPLHPIGYVMAGTMTADAFWSHYFMAWLVKLLLLRYGGLRLYRQTLPFVFGLILGDIACQTLWSLGASLLNVPVCQFVS